MAVGNIKRRLGRKGYTTMSNHCFKNKNISFKAKGMLAAMLSLPDGWGFSIAGLAGMSTDGESSVRSALAELKKEDYVRVYPKRDERGQIEAWCYDVCDEPIGDLPDAENPDVENPHVENPLQLNTNIESIDRLSTNGINEDNSSSRINTSKNNISSMGEKKTKKEIDLSFVGIEYLDAMERWIAFHKEIGKPYTKTGVEGAYRRLLMLSNQDARVADQIVEQSIANGWQGLFELKQSKQSNYGNNSNQASGGFFCQLADSLKNTRGVR
jgi:hypothetical protein